MIKLYSRGIGERMNNGYRNIPNNYEINNNFENNNNNENNGNGSNILFIGVIILLIIGVVFIFLLLFGDNTAEKNLEKEQQKEPTVSEKPKEEQPTAPEMEQNPENNQQNTQQPEQNQQTQNNNTQTTSKTSLKCTGTAKNEYGTYKYENTYTFKSNSTMKTATIKTTVTLNKSYVGYRDSIIQSLKEENKKFVKLDGISESVSKKSNGFTYTIKIDATKLSAKELADMGYRTRNYTGVKMKAKEQGLKCS